MAPWGRPVSAPVAAPTRAWSGFANLPALATRQAAAPVLIGVCIAAAAIAVGAAASVAPPLLFVGGLVAATLTVVVAVHPPVAAYVLIGVTPLIAGIDRDRLVPVLRPAEVLAFVLAGGLCAGGLIRLRTGRLPHLRLTRTDLSILALAVTSSVLPLAWMVVRHVDVTQDDILYALMMWKYYGVYLIVRFSVRTWPEVRRCVWISMASAAVVAVLAILQALQLFGVARLLGGLYAPSGVVAGLTNSRGGATLALPIAAADLMILNLGLAVGLLLKDAGRRAVLVPAMGLFAMGVLASGQISAMIALAIALFSLAVMTRRARIFATLAMMAGAAGLLLRPVIQARLAGFGTASGWPVSWEGRWSNLTNHFWPPLFSHLNFLLGVRVSARVPSSALASGYIWIESGYTWLLWAGGLPLLAAFGYFLWIHLSRAIGLAHGEGPVAAAGLALATGLIVIAVLMTIDPHLTYRGSADLLFALIALIGTPAAVPLGRGDERARAGSQSGRRQRPIERAHPSRGVRAGPPASRTTPSPAGSGSPASP
jgi:hypothetical protein